MKKEKEEYNGKHHILKSQFDQVFLSDFLGCGLEMDYKNQNSMIGLQKTATTTPCIPSYSALLNKV